MLPTIVKGGPDVGPVHGSLPDARRTDRARPLTWITDDMRASARELGCLFHRAWFAEDGSAFYALANWDSLDGAQTFFERWNITDEPGEVAITLLGDVGLVPDP
jgi:hypothetical protein